MHIWNLSHVTFKFIISAHIRTVAAILQGNVLISSTDYFKSVAVTFAIGAFIWVFRITCLFRHIYTLTAVTWFQPCFDLFQPNSSP